MKFTQYFEHKRKFPDRSQISLDWIYFTVKNPVKEEKQSDGRIRRWAFIRSENKYLRVVLLEDEETVHNAFFDRRFVL